jgi:hypothetical protein
MRTENRPRLTRWKKKLPEGPIVSVQVEQFLKIELTKIY